MTPRLKELYFKEIQPSLKSQFGFKNLYMGPKVEKIVLNMGVGVDWNDQNIYKSYTMLIHKVIQVYNVIIRMSYDNNITHVIYK